MPTYSSFQGSKLHQVPALNEPFDPDSPRHQSRYAPPCPISKKISALADPGFS
ncbi:hypothetical protein BDV12DRAFT_171526 [Aspergillus spectabilis]